MKNDYRDTDQILYDILQELKKLNAKLESKEENNDVPTGVPYKYCGGTHENRGQIMACAKKMKKEGI